MGLSTGQLENRASADHDRYLVKSVVHSVLVLSAFTCPDEALRLRDVANRTGLSTSMTFRLLRTLAHCGMIKKVGTKFYRPAWGSATNG